MDESTTMAIPLDSDGFVRRECPTCERELKWLVTDDEENAVLVPEGGYFCPYCGIQAPADGWLTQAQVELAHNIVLRDLLGPEVDRMNRQLRNASRGGPIRVEATYQAPAPLDPLVEADDMRRIDFACHPGEPVKILDDWEDVVRCLICGSFASVGE